MAAKKQKVPAPSGVAQITEAQKALISLMEGVKSAGLGHAEAQVALQTFGVDAGAALGDLVSRGFAVQMGNGLYALTRGADGRYAYQSGAAPVAAPPQPPQPPPAQPPAPVSEQARDDDDDMPYGTAFEQEVRDRLDAMDTVLRKIMSALGIPGGAPASAPVPPPPPTSQPQPPLQQWGAPPTGTGYTPMPPQGPPMTQPPPPAPWDGQQGPAPYAPPMPPQHAMPPQGYPMPAGPPMPSQGYPPPNGQPPAGYPPSAPAGGGGFYGYQTPGYPPRQ